jgi:hypothetical protein
LLPPQNSCSPEAATIIAAVEQSIMSALATAADMAQPLLIPGAAAAPAGASGGGGAQSVSASPQLLGLCCALSVLRELKDVAPPQWVAGTMSHVVKALNRCSREVAQPPAGPNHQAHYQALAAASAQRKAAVAAAAAAAAKAAGGPAKGDKVEKGDKGEKDKGDKHEKGEKDKHEKEKHDDKDKEKEKEKDKADEEPEYGTVTWAIHCALGLAGTLLPGFNPEAPQSVLEDPGLAQSKDESKRMLLQSLILLLTGSGAKWTDASLFTQVGFCGADRVPRRGGTPLLLLGVESSLNRSRIHPKTLPPPGHPDPGAAGALALLPRVPVRALAAAVLQRGAAAAAALCARGAGARADDGAGGARALSGKSVDKRACAAFAVLQCRPCTPQKLSPLLTRPPSRPSPLRPRSSRARRPRAAPRPSGASWTSCCASAPTPRCRRCVRLLSTV